MENADFFQNTCFKEYNIMAVSPNCWLTINLYKNNVFELSHGIKSIHRSKSYQWYTHLGKTFLYLLLFKGLWDVSFQSNKVYSILSSARVFFTFLEKRNPNRLWLWEEILIFHIQKYIMIGKKSGICRAQNFKTHILSIVMSEHSLDKNGHLLGICLK